MTEDWTVEISSRTPTDRPASKERISTNGTICGKPATLQTHGTSVRLTVSGFATSLEAEKACSRLCFGLRYMSLLTPIALEFGHTPRDVVFSPDPSEAAKNISKTFGSADFGEEVHGIFLEGSPAVYRTGQRMLMFGTGGEVRFSITGIGNPERALQLIQDGASSSAASDEIPRPIKLAMELFNLAGFETSPRAAFLIHCTALEVLFRPKPVDARTLHFIQKTEEFLASLEDSKLDAPLLKKLKERVKNLTSYSIAWSVGEGVAQTLAPSDPEAQKQIKKTIKDIHSVRHNLAHSGKADLGEKPQKIQTILRSVIINYIIPPKTHSNADR